MKFDKRTEQIIALFTDPNSFSPLMRYEEIFRIDTKRAAKEYYKRVKHLNPRVEKRKYFDSLLNEQYEAWYISVTLKHSVIDAFFFPIGSKTKVVILRKDRPYITLMLGIATIIVIILFGKLFISFTLNPLKLLATFAIASVLLGCTIYAAEKLTLPNEIKEIIRDFDAALFPYREEEVDRGELERTEIKSKEKSDAAKELEES